MTGWFRRHCGGRWSSNGYAGGLAEDGQQAIDAVTRERPDAMVLDMTTLRVDGLTVCRRLRSAGDCPAPSVTSDGGGSFCHL
jgi:CheY-like chemotaxis protein